MVEMSTEHRATRHRASRNWCICLAFVLAAVTFFTAFTAEVPEATSAAGLRKRPKATVDIGPHYPIPKKHIQTSEEIIEPHPVWQRGWYTVTSPSNVSLDYFNTDSREDGCSQGWFGRERRAFETSCGVIWIFTCDLLQWTRDVLPHLECAEPVTVLLSGRFFDFPASVAGATEAIASPKVRMVQSTNVVDLSAKVRPLPLGLALHYAAFSVRNHTAGLWRIYTNMQPFAARPLEIIYNRGTLGVSPRRDKARRKADHDLDSCAAIKSVGNVGGELFTHFAQYPFGVSVTGVGWDCYRTWELLFFHTVPIILSSPIDHMFLNAHVPVIIVDDYTVVCSWEEKDLRRLRDDFLIWITHSHRWLDPSLWAPYDQSKFDNLCDEVPGCKRNYSVGR